MRFISRRVLFAFSSPDVKQTHGVRRYRFSIFHITAPTEGQNLVSLTLYGGKSLPIHAVFKNVDFSCANTKKKNPPFLLQRGAVGPGNAVGCERTRFPITRSSL